MRKCRTQLNRYRPAGKVVLLALLASAVLAPAADPGGAKVDGTYTAQKAEAAALRDPFWPVGYKPKRMMTAVTNGPIIVVEQEVSTDWNKAMQEVAIQGVSSRAGNEFYAVINGEVKSMGDTVSVQVGKSTYTWMVENISPPSSVKMRRLTVQ